MKIFSFSRLAILLVCGCLTVALGEQAAKTANVHPGPDFDMTGTVKIHEGPTICMMRIDFDLHSAGNTTTFLVDGSRSALKVLGDAARKGKPVRVQGNWMQATECKYVKVSKAMTLTGKK